MYLIGYILKPQGLKGEVKVDPVSPDLNRYKRLNKVYIKIDGKLQTCSIEKVRISDRLVFLKFIGIDTRDDAELLRNGEILIEANDLIRPSPDEYFVHDLIDCRVISDEGEEIGTIVEVVQMSSNDIYVVKDMKGKEILVPAIKQVIKQVDIENKQLTVHLLEGLTE